MGAYEDDKEYKADLKQRIIQEDGFGILFLTVNELDRIAGLRRAVAYGLEHGKKNMIVDLDLLAAILEKMSKGVR